MKRPGLGTLLSVLLLSIASAGGFAAITSPAYIKQAVEKKIEQALGEQNLGGSSNQRISFSVSGIDPRLRLAQCTKPLQISLNGRRLMGRISAKVTCENSTPWSIYVPATIKLYKKVLVASAALARNQVIQPNQLAIVERDVSNLTQGYFTDPGQVLGKQLKRSVAFNGIVTPNMVIEPMAVKKGDQVIIRASNGALTVSSNGIALINGRIGQQIQVRNQSSKRIIKARVIDRGLVAVAL